MLKIGIISGKTRQKTTEYISAVLSNENIHFDLTELLRFDSEALFDIIILNMSGDDPCLFFGNNPDPKHVILNSDVKSNITAAKNFKRPPLTFGLNNKACVTASSLGIDSITCCVQRQFRSINKIPVLQQEIVFNIGCDENTAVSILAAVSCALLCGIAPEKIKF